MSLKVVFFVLFSNARSVVSTTDVLQVFQHEDEKKDQDKKEKKTSPEDKDKKKQSPEKKKKKKDSEKKKNKK